MNAARLGADDSIAAVIDAQPVRGSKPCTSSAPGQDSCEGKPGTPAKSVWIERLDVLAESGDVRGVKRQVGPMTWPAVFVRTNTDVR